MNALIIETHELYRLSLKEIVSLMPSFDKILDASSEQEFLSLTAQDVHFDLIVITPHQLGQDGIKWLHLVRRLFPNAAILSFYNREKPASITEADSNCEMLPRDASVQQTFSSLRRLLKLPQVSFSGLRKDHQTGSVIDALKQSVQPCSQSNTKNNEIVERLSLRQRQILAMAADGLPNKEIAARLDIAEGTVKAHMHSIFKVLGVTNRTQAVLQFSTTPLYSAQTYSAA